MADEYEEPVNDYIAARAAAFATLVAQADCTKNEKLRAECVLMLRAVRTSFKTVPQGQLSIVSKLEQMTKA